MFRKITSQIPNILTLSNLFLGCLAIISAFYSDWNSVAIFVLLAAVVDFLDGFVARLLNAYSDIGKDLDSLADCVTFGVVPGFVVYMHLLPLSEPNLLAYFAFLIPLFSALRLAKFNHDTRQSNCFYGLPTPANGLFIVFLPLALDYFNVLEGLNQSFIFWLGISLVQSFLLIAPFRLQAFKFKNFSMADNWPRYLIVACSLPLLLIFSYFAIPFVVVGYILISILSNFYQTDEIQS